MNQIAAPLLTARAEATRAAIVATAERLFRALGYQKTTVADIARDLHMSSANIYRFFPSKAAVSLTMVAKWYHAGMPKSGAGTASLPPNGFIQSPAPIQLSVRSLASVDVESPVFR